MNIDKYNDELIYKAIVSLLRDIKQHNFDNKIKYDRIVENTALCFREHYDKTLSNLLLSNKEKIWNE